MYTMANNTLLCFAEINLVYTAFSLVLLIVLSFVHTTAVKKKSKKKIIKYFISF